MGQYPAPGTLRCTSALSEGSLVAQKFFYEGGYAVWAASPAIVSFYYEDGGLLRSLTLGVGENRIAA